MNAHRLSPAGNAGNRSRSEHGTGDVSAEDAPRERKNTSGLAAKLVSPALLIDPPVVENAPKPTRILCVDDMPAVLKLLDVQLSKSGYDVVCASNGREALSLLGDEDIRLVLSDWEMPEMDGLDLCRAVREADTAGYVYVVILTGNSKPEQLVEAFDAGADDYLVKPFSKYELLARLRGGERTIRLHDELSKQRLEVHKANAEMAVLNEKLERLATTDELTGLGNRREALRSLDESLANAERRSQPISCVLMDIDHFKNFNDTHGHDVGDVVLREIARTMRSTARKGERVFRLGGEEFLLVCPFAPLEEAEKAGERLRKAVEQKIITSGGLSLKVTISCGAAARDDETTGPNDLLKRADLALYAAKEGGRNRVCAFTPSLLAASKA